MDGPTPHELSERVARLEERMKTMQAEYKTDIALLAKTSPRTMRNAIPKR